MEQLPKQLTGEKFFQSNLLFLIFSVHFAPALLAWGAVQLVLKEIKGLEEGTEITLYLQQPTDDNSTAEAAPDVVISLVMESLRERKAGSVQLREGLGPAEQPVCTNTQRDSTQKMDTGS